MESYHQPDAEDSPHASIGPPALPVEIWQQIIMHSMNQLSVRNAIALRLVSRDFSLMTMKAIYESRILRRCWQLSEESRKSQFWVDYLTARAMDQVRTLEPSYEHLWLKALAESILKFRQEERERGHRPGWGLEREDELESLVRRIAEFATYHGQCNDSLNNFYLGLRTCGISRAPALALDESCGLFRDALLAVAVYLNEVAFLQDRLDAGSKIACRHHAPPGKDVRHPRQAPFNCLPTYSKYVTSGFNRNLSSSEDAARFTFGTPIMVAMRHGRVQCLKALLKSLADFPSELLVCRAEILREADRLGKLEYMRLAIESDPPFTVCPEVTAMAYRFHENSRKEYAVFVLCDFFNNTTNLEVFDLLYPAMTANCGPGESPFWERYRTTDDFGRWGTKRMYKAIHSGCLPIVKRLVQLKFSVGPQPMVEALESGHSCMVEYFFDLGVRLDGALAATARSGDAEMAQILLDKGAGKNKESVRSAVEEAMLHCNEAMVRFLVKKARAGGVLNKKAKASLKREMESKKVTEDMFLLLKLL